MEQSSKTMSASLDTYSAKKSALRAIDFRFPHRHYLYQFHTHRLIYRTLSILFEKLSGNNLYVVKFFVKIFLETLLLILAFIHQSRNLL